MWDSGGAPALWELIPEHWLEEMMEHHRQELLQLGGGPVLEWRCDYEPVLRSLQCRQLVRKAEEQAALRAADAAAQRSHADASFLDRWQCLAREQQAEVRQVAGDFEAELQRWCQLISALELPSLGREDWWDATQRARAGYSPLPPRAGPWRRLLQAAAAPRAAAAGAWGAQRCAAVAERLATAQGALPQELLAELSGRLAGGSLGPPLARAADAVLSAQSQPDADMRSQLEYEAAHQSVGSLDPKYGPTLDALWAQLTGPMGDPWPSRGPQ